MAKIDFRVAVELAKEKILGWQNMPTTGLQALRIGQLGQTFDFTDPSVYREMMLRDVGAAMLRNTPYTLLENASENAESFEALRLALIAKLEHPSRDLLTPAEREWLAKYLAGDVVSPKKNSGARGKNTRDIAVWATIRHLERLGITASRNEVKQTDEPYNSCEPFCGCDVVAAAFHELEQTPQTYRSVENVWKKMRKKEKVAKTDK